MEFIFMEKPIYEILPTSFPFSPRAPQKENHKKESSIGSYSIKSELQAHKHIIMNKDKLKQQGKDIMSDGIITVFGWTHYGLLRSAEMVKAGSKLLVAVDDYDYEASKEAFDKLYEERVKVALKDK